MFFIILKNQHSITELVFFHIRNKWSFTPLTYYFYTLYVWTFKYATIIVTNFNWLWFIIPLIQDWIWFASILYSFTIPYLKSFGWNVFAILILLKFKKVIWCIYYDCYVSTPVESEEVPPYQTHEYVCGQTYECKVKSDE